MIGHAAGGGSKKSCGICGCGVKKVSRGNGSNSWGQARRSNRLCFGLVLCACSRAGMHFRRRDQQTEDGAKRLWCSAGARGGSGAHQTTTSPVPKGSEEGNFYEQNSNPATVANVSLRPQPSSVHDRVEGMRTGGEVGGSRETSGNGGGRRTRQQRRRSAKAAAVAAIGAAATAKGAAEWADIVAAESAEGLWGEDCGEVSILEAMAEWAVADGRSASRRGKCDEGGDAEETREAITMIVEAGPALDQQQAGQPEKPGEQAEVEQLLLSR